jgi:hypothetical protein
MSERGINRTGCSQGVEGQTTTSIWVHDIEAGVWGLLDFPRGPLHSEYDNSSGPAERDSVSSRRCKPTDLYAERAFRPWRGRT